MKKNLIVIVLMLMALPVLAQEKGFFVSGSMNYWRANQETNFTIIPEVGYNFNKRIGAGVEFSIKGEAYSVAPFVRYTFLKKDNIKLFVDGTIGYSNTDELGGVCTGSEFGLKPGILIGLTKHISVKAKYAFLGYRDNYTVAGRKFEGYGLDLSFNHMDIGIQFNF